MNQNIFLTAKGKLSKPLLYIESFFSTLAIMRIANLHTMNIMAFLLFLLIIVFFSTLTKEILLHNQADIKTQKKISAILSTIFTLFFMSDTYKTFISDLSNGLFQLSILLAVAIGLYLLLYKGILYLICRFSRFEMKDSSRTDALISKFPLISFLIIVLCRIPWLLYSYPGIMTPDSINQFAQALGIAAYNNHHPWVHTLTISAFYHLGTLFTDNINDAFVFFTIFQICFMAFASAYLIHIISKYTRSFPLLCGITAIYAFLPYHSVMVLCIWKDVMFSGAMLLFCTSLFYLLKEGFAKKTLPSIILYFIAGFLMCVYRSNGWYAFLLTFPFLLFAFRKQWKRSYPLHFALLTLVIFIKGPVMDYYEVKQPDFIESISIPLQQVGRVIATGQELTAKQQELVNRVLDSSYVPESYTEFISDNMKELARAGSPEYLTSHKSEYFKLWIELGLKYPNIYLDAYIAQTRGYYSPSAVYQVAEVDNIIDNDTGLYREYLINGSTILKLREILIKLQNIIPLYGSLWSMGSLFWATLLFLGLTLGKTLSFNLKSKMNFVDLITVWVPNIAVIATLLIATPVAIEFRYAYNLAYCIPLYFAIMMISRRNKT